ncbi:MAG: flagellar hook-length control protein FliK [Desulfamplus sp.]|nr:flagellar hook-length control protein FliK [Desulfamplus sp.]
MNFDFVTPQLFMNKGFKSGSVDSSSLSGQNFADSDSASNLFLNKLHQMLAKNGIKQNLLSTVGGQGALTGSNNPTVGATSSEIDVLSEDAKMDLLKDVKNTQGFEFLTKFKQYLMASGHNDLKAISLDEDALETIKSMLIKAGFPQSRIADLIKTLRSESDDGNVFMSDLMDGLLNLDPDDLFSSDSPMDIDAFSIDIKDDQDDTSSDSNGKNFDVLMDISSIPFFTSIMKSLGIPDDVADSIISDSEVKGEGIHLNTLILDLQKLQKNAFFTGTTFKASSDSESIKGMFNQLGLSVEKSAVNGQFNQLGLSAEKSAVNGKINLGDFVSVLEDFRQKSVSEKGGSNVLTGHSLSLHNSLNSFKTSNFSGLPNELSINGFNQSRNNSFSLIDNKVISQIDAHSGNSERASIYSDMDSRSLKKSNHQLPMNLSGTKQPGENSFGNDSSGSLKSTNTDEMEHLLDKLMTKLNSDSKSVSSSESDLASSQADTGKNKLKNSFDMLNETLQKKIMSLSQVQDEQNAKTSSDIIIGKAAAEGARNGEILSDLVNMINNNEALVSGKRMGQDTKSGHNEKEVDLMTSRIERKQTINILDSNQSGGNFSDGRDPKDGTSSLAKDKATSSLLPSYVTNQVGRSIARALSRGESEIKLQLRPAELGRILMTIETLGDTLKVSIVTENQAAKDILLGHANELKASLANSGIKIESFDVEMGSDFRQSLADSGQHSNQSNQSNSGSGRNRDSGQHDSIFTGNSDGSSASEFLTDEDGMLHFVA